jgi:hypothetical protein
VLLMRAGSLRRIRILMHVSGVRLEVAVELRAKRIFPAPLKWFALKGLEVKNGYI